MATVMVTDMATSLVRLPASHLPQHGPVRVYRRAARLLLALLAVPSMAGVWEMQPSVSLSETISDNASLQSGDSKNEAITELSPGIRLRGTGDRLSVNLDYRLQRHIYARESEKNKTRHALGANASLEAIENWLFVDANATISQQDISAFGGSPLGDNSSNPNRTETANYRLSPYVRGQLGGWAAYQLKYTQSLTKADSAQVADIDNGTWSAGLSGLPAPSGLGWGLDGNGQTIEYENGRRSRSESARLLLSYQFDPQFKLAVFAGKERNNHASPQMQSNDTPGASLEWSPSSRTQITASWQRRFFGDGSSFSFSHRSALTAWRLSSSKDISVVPNQFGEVTLGSFFDLYFNLFASQEPDPIKRAVLVRNFLLLNGIPPNGTVSAGFLASRISVQRQHQGSVAILGANNSLTLSASQSDSRGLLAASNLSDDFDSVDQVRQQSLSLNWAHRFSPLSSLSLMLVRQRSQGSGATSLETTTDGLNLLFSTQLSPFTRASLGFRRSVVEGASDYAENALTGTVSHQF